jgi:hypothetical protein
LPYACNGAVSKANEEWRRFTNEQSQRQQARTVEQEDLFGGTLTTEVVSEQNTRTEIKLNQEWIDTIADNITTLTAVHGSVDVQSHTKALFGTTLGLAPETHLRVAWDQLSDRGVVLPRLNGTNNKIENQTIRPA